MKEIDDRLAVGQRPPKEQSSADDRHNTAARIVPSSSQSQRGLSSSAYCRRSWFDRDRLSAMPATAARITVTARLYLSATSFPSWPHRVWNEPSASRRR